MLSSVLNSDRAIKVNIQIMRIYSKVRLLLLTHKDVLLRLEKIEQKLLTHDKSLALIFDYLKQLVQSNQEEIEFEKRKRIGFKRPGED